MRHLITLTVVIISALNTGCMSRVESELSDFKTKAGESVKPGPVTSWEKSSSAGYQLNPTLKTHVILQVDGGGIMGITPAVVLQNLENELRKTPEFRNKKLRDMFSVCCGTSTGAIIAGMVAAGVPADKIADSYVHTGKDLFSRTGRYHFPVFPFFRTMLSREKFYDAFADVLGHDSDYSRKVTLGELYNGPLLIITAFNLTANSTQFFRTRRYDGQRLNTGNHADHSNANVQLMDVIAASALSAPGAFNQVDAPGAYWEQWRANGETRVMQGAAYNDGGQGTQNNTIALATLEAVVREWMGKVGNDEQVVIISLGTGNNYESESYEKASKRSTVSQLLAFLSNQARPESGLLQWQGASYLAMVKHNFKVCRFDWVTDREYDSPLKAFTVTDKDVAKYVGEANKISRRESYKVLVKSLCRLIRNNNIAAVGPDSGPFAALQH